MQFQVRNFSRIMWPIYPSDRAGMRLFPFQTSTSAFYLSNGYISMTGKTYFGRYYNTRAAHLELFFDQLNNQLLDQPGREINLLAHVWTL